MTTEINILNMSENAHKYEFIVARLCEGDFWFYGAYKDGFRADAAAREVNGVVFHNVRIQGYKED
jgi:precorrin-4 methylase